MFVKPFAVFIFAVASGSILADEGKPKFFLEAPLQQSSDNLGKSKIWKPTSNGLTRFNLILPSHGITEALKYQDTASLFYLSRIDDTGLSLIGEINRGFDLLVRPEKLTFGYHSKATTTFSYTIGVQKKDDVISPMVGGQFKYITGSRSLAEYFLSLSNSSLDAIFAHTGLTHDENSEVIWSLSSDSNKLSATYGRRWFDLTHHLDFLAELGLNSSGLVIGGQLEREFEGATGYIGALNDISPGTIEVILGVRFNIGQGSKVRLENDAHLLSNHATTLNSLRRRSLPALWRSNIDIKKEQDSIR